MNHRSPLALAKARGSARLGTSAWLWQRVTALFLIPFVFWLAQALVRLPAMDYATARTWLAHPVNGTLLSAAICLLIGHALLGLRTIIEDYVHDQRAKWGVLWLVQFVFLLMGLASIRAIWRVGTGD